MTTTMMSPTGTGRHLVACYGSLKQGFYNHYMLGDDKEFKGTLKLRGVMYLCGSYPRLYNWACNWEKTDKPHPDVEGHHACTPFCENLERSHEIEVYEVNHDAYIAIKYMELGAGYVEEDIDTEWGVAKIYYSKPEAHSKYHQWIEAYTQAAIDGDDEDLTDDDFENLTRGA